jgi:hypothetical protein
MAAPDTPFVKAWCRIDGTEFDAILPAMIAQATALASHETGVDYSTTTMPDGVKMWCCAHIAHWLTNPAASSERQEVNPYFNGLLDPHRTYTMEVLPV